MPSLLLFDFSDVDMPHTPEKSPASPLLHQRHTKLHGCIKKRKLTNPVPKHRQLLLAVIRKRRRATEAKNSGTITPTGCFRFRFPDESIRCFMWRAAIPRTRLDTIDLMSLTMETLLSRIYHRCAVVADFRQKRVITTRDVEFLIRSGFFRRVY